MNKWLFLSAGFNFNSNNIIFKGQKLPGQNSQAFPLQGMSIYGENFVNGEISVNIKFNKLEPEFISGFEFMLNYSNVNDKTNFIGIGINCLKYFSFRYREHIDNEDKYTSYFGSPSNVKENEDIKLSISIYGSNLSFYFNDILAFQKTISLPLLNNQIGVFCSSTDKISIDNFRIDSNNRKIFVVMQFGEEYDELYKDVIYEVSHNKYNFDVIRVDESYKACTIVSDIIRYITEASVIIADISPDNLNVFYELGYAHALNKPTILLCDKNLRKELPFDIHDFRTIFYENSIHGKKDIEEKLSRFLENI